MLFDVILRHFQTFAIMKSISKSVSGSIEIMHVFQAVGSTT